MAFRLTERHIEQYYKDGYTVFESLISPSLLHELRAMAERGRAIHWAKPGMTHQRLSPIQKYDIGLDAFHEMAHLPELQEALLKLLGPDVSFVYTDKKNLTTDASILYEPRNDVWCTNWHRDQRDNIAGMDVFKWEARLLDWRLFNQMNLPLYHDVSTWVVPGSHLRRDLPSEVALFPDRPINPPVEWEHCPTDEHKEAAALAHCRSMPGGVELNLHPGDLAIYRNCLWHLGTYSCHRKRATLHAPVWTPEYLEWSRTLPFRPDGKREYMNPNVPAEKPEALAALRV